MFIGLVIMLLLVYLALSILFGESDTRIGKLKKSLKEAETEELELLKSILEKELNKRGE